MTTAFDTRFRALANRLITDVFGTDATLSRESETFDEVTNLPTDGSPTTYPLAISPPTFADIQEIADIQERDGERVLATDMFCLTPAANAGGTNIAGLPLNVDKDTLTFDGVVYKVVGFNPVYSGDLVAMYKIHMRK
jgi:hypothetical protein